MKNLKLALMCVVAFAVGGGLALAVVSSPKCGNGDCGCRDKVCAKCLCAKPNLTPCCGK